MTGTTTPSVDAAFVEGWRAALRTWTPAVRVTSALFKLTNAGEWSTTVHRLAGVSGLPPNDAVRLVTAMSRGARVDGDSVRFEVETTPGPGARFELGIGGRTHFGGGCAPDQYSIAFLVDRPVEILASCQATSVPIRLVV